VDTVQSLEKTRWTWVSSRDANGQRTVVSEPERYEVFFLEGHDLALKAGCNRVLGAYASTDNTLSLELGPSIKAMCPPDSRDDSFLRQFMGVTGFQRDGDSLFLFPGQESQSMELVFRCE
jgi:heat shock protein HslJ